MSGTHPTHDPIHGSRKFIHDYPCQDSSFSSSLPPSLCPSFLPSFTSPLLLSSFFLSFSSLTVQTSRTVTRGGPHVKTWSRTEGRGSLVGRKESSRRQGLGTWPIRRGSVAHDNEPPGREVVSLGTPILRYKDQSEPQTKTKRKNSRIKLW